MQGIYILEVQEDSPVHHPVAFATLKAAQDYVHRWHGAYLDWNMETLFDIGGYCWRADPQKRYFPFYIITLHPVQQEREEDKE